ncbi:hypothetical protein ACM66B_000420 [Microbotryomycetes sp. NB124-2]
MSLNMVASSLVVRSHEFLQDADEPAWPNGHLPLSLAIAYVINFVLLGLVLSQTATYASHFVFGRGRHSTDALAYRLLVGAMLLCFLAHSGMAAETIMEGILGKENSPPLGAEWTAQSIIIFIPIVLSQIWALWRVWVVSHHRVLPVAGGAVLVLSSIVTFVLYLAFRGGEDMLRQQHHGQKYYLSLAVTTVAADLLLTILFVSYALKLRSQAFDKQTKHTIATMYNVALQASAPTAVCSIAMVAAAAAPGQFTLFASFQALLPALDLVAVLYTRVYIFKTSRLWELTTTALTVNSRLHGPRDFRNQIAFDFDEPQALQQCSHVTTTTGPCSLCPRSRLERRGTGRATTRPPVQVQVYVENDTKSESGACCSKSCDDLHHAVDRDFQDVELTMSSRSRHHQHSVEPAQEYRVDQIPPFSNTHAQERDESFDEEKA